MKELSPRTLTTYYIVALILLASLVALCHVALVRELALSERSAAVINLTGRQRLLSQRIAGMAAEYRLNVPGARETLLRDAASFEQNYDDLLTETNAMPLDQPARQRLLDLYLAGPGSLQQRIHAFTAAARQLADTPPGSPAVVDLSSQLFMQARSPLLDKLGRVISLQQQQSQADIQLLQRNQDLLLAAILLTLALEAFFLFRPMVQHITVYSSTLVAIASTDSLTGLPNRRAFLDSGNQEIVRAHRYQRPLTLLLLDVDNFKAINDTHGHAVGDYVLKTLADSLIQALRSMDLPGRIGGEEFAILLPETSIDSATLVAERIRRLCDERPVPYADRFIHVTVSIGLAQVSAALATLPDVMLFADRALYRAKAAGRNRVVAASTSQPNPLSV